MPIAWKKSHIRENRYTAQVGTMKLALYFSARGHQWVLEQNRMRLAVAAQGDAEGVLREIAELYCVGGKPIKEVIALVSANRKIVLR